MPSKISAPGSSPSPSPTTDECAAPRPVPARLAVADDPVVREHVGRDLDVALWFSRFFPSDSDLGRVVNDLAQLSTPDLQRTLSALDADGRLDDFLGQQDSHREAFEGFFCLLEQRGLVAGHELPWKAGAYGVRPPALLSPAPGAALPPSARFALEQRNVRVHQDYEAQGAAFSKKVHQAKTDPASPVRVDRPATQPGLARTPEEAARFTLGAPPSLSDALDNPADAVASAFRYASRQGDLALQMRSLEVGDSVELKVELGVAGKVNIERTAKDTYDVTASLELLFGPSTKASLDVLGLAKFEASLGAKAGLTGAVKLRVSSPEEFEALVVAVRTRIPLDGVPKDDAQLKSFRQAGAFIAAHVVGGRLGAKTESTAAFGLTSRAGDLGVEAKSETDFQFEVDRTPDGRRATTLREDFKVSAKAKGALGLLKRENEEVTRLMLERTTAEPARPGEAPVLTLKVECEDKRGRRVDTRTVSITVKPEDLGAWQRAILTGDREQVAVLLRGSEAHERRETAYVEKHQLNKVSTSVKRVVQEETR